MKKIVISLAGLLAAVAFVPEASAIPAFARQTGLACQACHFQHFPLLNSFGRAFKSSGFTMMGAQAKVEGGEHVPLSIPAQLNISALATAGYNSISNQPAGTPRGSYLTPNGGGELSLFFGGRVSENIGFLSELAFPDNSASNSAAKLPMLWDMGNNTRVGLVLMANNAPAWSLELLNTGAVSTHRLMGNPGAANAVSGGTGNHINATSAAQYLGTKAAGHGVSFVATGDMGFMNLGKYNLTGSTLGNNTVGGPAGGTAASPSNTMSTTYARAAYLFNAGGWDSAVGIQSFSGTKGSTTQNTKATIIDGQMQGEAGGMPLGIYASYGRAPANLSVGNLYNAGTTDKKSFNIAGELGVIPHKATVQLAFRSGKNGGAAGADTDNAIMLAGTYELAQNVELSLTHTANSGNAYNVGVTPPAALAATPATGVVGKTQTTLLLEALF